jgi:Phosphotransferase enzyme family
MSLWNDSQFTVLSRYWAALRSPEEPYIVISITTPKLPEATLAESVHRQGVLRLQFDDTGDYGQPLREATLFSKVHAIAILSFIEAHRGIVSHVVVHCEAGASRSPAVAAVICRLWGGDDHRFFTDFSPNRYVYRQFRQFAKAYGYPEGKRLIGKRTQPPEVLWDGNAHVTRIVTEQGVFIRKQSDNKKSDNEEMLAREEAVLSSLNNVWVPKPLGRDGCAFFQSCVAGTPLSDLIADATLPERVHLATCFGEALRTIHAWFPENDDGHVYSHGDWCLPNVLATDGHITGIVDWSDGGFADRRLDLGTGLWTLRYNLCSLRNAPTDCLACETAFLQGYGWAEGSDSLQPFVDEYGEL